MSNYANFRFPGHFAGPYASVPQLPNSAGATQQHDNLRTGDLAQVTGVGLYVCVDRTRGAAVWQPLSASPPAGGQVIDLYVDGANGSDLNAGTIAAPFATLQPVADTIGLLPVTAHYVVHIVDATSPYDMDPILNINWGALGKSINFVGEVFTDADSGTTTAGTGNVLTDTGQAWTADEHAGRFCRVTSGTAIGKRYMILANDATTLTLSSPTAATAIGIGAAYAIFDPAVALQSTTGGTFGSMGAAPFPGDRAFHATRLINVTLQGDGGTRIYPFVGNVETYGVRALATASIISLARAGASENTSTFDLATPLGLADNTLWFGYGFNALARTSLTVGGQFLGSVAAESITAGHVGGTGLFFGSRAMPSTNDIGFSIGTGVMASVGSALGGVCISRPVAGGAPTGVTGVAFDAGAAGFIVNATIDTLLGATGTGILAIANGALKIATTTTAATLYGLYARFGSKVYLFSDGSTLTGVTANLAAGETPATGASLAAVGNILTDNAAVDDGSTIQRVA